MQTQTMGPPGPWCSHKGLSQASRSSAGRMALQSWSCPTVGKGGRALWLPRSRSFHGGYPQGGADLRPEGSPLKATAWGRRDCSDWAISHPSQQLGEWTLQAHRSVHLRSITNAEAHGLSWHWRLRPKSCCSQEGGSTDLGTSLLSRVPDSKGAPRAGRSPDTRSLPKTKPRNLGNCTLAHRNMLPFGMALLT